MLTPDVLIVGAGPAGMSAALAACQAGLDVLVVDEQPAPGGQIWRGIEANTNNGRAAAFGAEYQRGMETVRAFRSADIAYMASTTVWQIEPSLRSYLKAGDQMHRVEPRSVIIATGAQERPCPFPGWTLPGVMTVGAAQILLKTPGAIPDKPVWIAGSGPLTLLYAQQLIKSGGAVAGFLDTRPATPLRHSVQPGLSALLYSGRDLFKGLCWYAHLRRHAGRYIKHVTDIEAVGHGTLERVRYRTANGRTGEIETSTLLVHEGVIPELHVARSLGCAIRHDRRQHAFAPVLNRWGESTVPNVFVAGDAAGIGGAAVAIQRGILAGLGVAASLGQLTPQAVETAAARPRKRCSRAMGIRRFLDHMFTPRASIFLPRGDTLVCRCEELRADDIRAQATSSFDVNHVKARTRAGMGPCQGRQCGYTVASLIAERDLHPIKMSEPFRVRPPLRPIRICDLAALAGPTDAP